MTSSLMGSYFDPTYLLVIIGAVICLIAQAKVKSTFNKYSQVLSKSGTRDHRTSPDNGRIFLVQHQIDRYHLDTGFCFRRNYAQLISRGLFMYIER